MDECAAQLPCMSSSLSSPSCSRASSPRRQCTASGADHHGILAQFWNPCTGDIPMGRHMDYLQFPVSYRYLFYKWRRLGEPRLQMLRTPLNLQLGYPKRHSVNLQEISEAQEGRIIEALQTTLDSGFTLSRPNLFVGFASHLNIYCAVHAELMGIEGGDVSIETQAKTYEATWRNLLEAFELDRSVCLARQKHDCIGYLIWGEMYFWPLLEIRRRFEAYRRRSSSANLSTSAELGSSSLQPMGLYSPVLNNGAFACSSSMPAMSPHARCHSLSQIVAGPMPLVSSTSSMGTLTPSSNSEVQPFTPISHGGPSHDNLPRTPSSSYAPRSMSRSSPSFMPEKDAHLLDDKAWSDALALLQTLKDADEQTPSSQNRNRPEFVVESPTDMSFSPTSPPFDGHTDGDAEQQAGASAVAVRRPLQRRYHSVLEEAANFLTATSKVFEWSTSSYGPT